MAARTVSRKIVVPDGMRKAAGAATKGVDPEGYIIYLGIEAAFQWLADNPLVPTQKQALALREVALRTNAAYEQSETTAAACMDVVMEWQRIMLLAPEPAVPSYISAAFRGTTLTREEAAAIHDLVNMCTERSKEPRR